MIFFIDAGVSVFSVKQSRWTYHFVVDGYAGSFFTCAPGLPSVAASMLGMVVPHDMSKTIGMDWTGRSYKVQFVRGCQRCSHPSSIWAWRMRWA